MKGTAGCRLRHLKVTSCSQRGRKMKARSSKVKTKSKCRAPRGRMGGNQSSAWPAASSSPFSAVREAWRRLRKAIYLRLVQWVLQQSSFWSAWDDSLQCRKAMRYIKIWFHWEREHVYMYMCIHGQELSQVSSCLSLHLSFWDTDSPWTLSSLIQLNLTGQQIPKTLPPPSRTHSDDRLVCSFLRGC